MTRLSRIKPGSGGGVALGARGPSPRSVLLEEKNNHDITKPKQLSAQERLRAVQDLSVPKSMYDCGRPVAPVQAHMVTLTDDGGRIVNTLGLGTCGMRNCPWCVCRKQADDAVLLEGVVRTWARLRGELVFVTLTVPNSADPSVGALVLKAKSLMRRKFRRWMTRLTKGVDIPTDGEWSEVWGDAKPNVYDWWRLETTFNLITREFHPHLHGLMFIPPGVRLPKEDESGRLMSWKRAIYKMWRAAVREASRGTMVPLEGPGVDVRRWNVGSNPAGAGRYLAGLGTELSGAGKGAKKGNIALMRMLDFPELRESWSSYVNALSGMHIVRAAASFGPVMERLAAMDEGVAVVDQEREPVKLHVAWTTSVLWSFIWSNRYVGAWRRAVESGCDAVREWVWAHAPPELLFDFVCADEVRVEGKDEDEVQALVLERLVWSQMRLKSDDLLSRVAAWEADNAVVYQ